MTRRVLSTTRPIRVLVCVALLLAAACSFDDGEPAAASGEPAPTGSADEAVPLRVGVQFSPDAGYAIDTDDAFVLTNMGVAEGLVASAADAAAEPGLAESWERTDELTWRFRLRPDVPFQDGTTLDADAVVGALEYVLGSATPPRGLSGDTTTVEAVEPLVVEVTTTEPDPILPVRLSSPSTSILAPSAYGGEGPPEVFGTGTGPFELVDETPNERAVLEAFDDHWAGAPELAGAEVRFIPDSVTRATALRSGELDIAEGVPVSQVPLLSDEEGLVVETIDLPRTTTLYTNVGRDPFGDPRVREALSLAIDREGLSDGVLEGAAVPAAGAFRPDDPWAADVDAPGHDPGRARELLAEAGVEELRVGLWTYTDRAELADLATAVQGMLAEVGVTTEIRISEYAALEAEVLEGEYDLFILSRSYLTDINDPGGFLASDYTCDGSYNLNGHCSEELDALVAEFGAVGEESDRHRLFADAEALLVQDVVGVPLVHDRSRTGVSDAVDGFVPDPLGQHLLTTRLALRG